MAVHALRVWPLPRWLDLRRLLGPTSADDSEARGWALDELGDGAIVARATLETAPAAELAARLRGIGLDGAPLHCEIEPPLRRAAIRRARTDDAVRRRSTTPGFSRAGVRLDDEGRISLTPERIALRVAQWAEGRPVVDAGCGVGGNTLAVARRGCRVTAIERDAGRLQLARHNAEVYGVSEHIHFVHGDAVELVPRHADEHTILFVDPPWGRDWDRRATRLPDLPLLAALLPAASGYGELWAKLPPSFATTELADAEPRALFGEAEGDRRRIKFVLSRRIL